jgi:tetratricopeptide (TPR) repeat protein
LEKARGLAPQDAGVLHALGLAYARKGRNAEAVAALEQTIAADADFPAAHNALGGMHAEMGDGTKAEAALREALRHQPDYAEAHENLGRLLANREAYPEAEFHLRAAIRWKRMSAWRSLGELQASRGLWTHARTSFTTALQAMPGDPAAWLGLGMAQAGMGDTAGARISLRRAAGGSDESVRKEALEILMKLQ